MEYIQLLTIIILCFSLRFVFIITKSSDVSLHLWHVKKSKIIGFGKHNAFNSIIDGIKGYPSLNNFIVSLFPEKKQIKAAYILNITYDCISIIIFYFIAKFIFSRYSISGGTQISELPFIATVLFGTSPILFPFTSRLKSFGGRTFGNLMNIIYFSSLGFFLMNGNYIFLIPSVISGLLILLSSQFGMQVMILFSIGLSITSINLAPIILVCLVFFLGLAPRQLGIRDIVKHKINHYFWYINNYRIGTTASDRNRLKDFFFYPIIIFKSSRRFYELTFKKLTPVIAVYSLPTLIFIIFLIPYEYDTFRQLLDNSIVRYLFQITLCSCIIFIFISFKWLSFLGEAERYFEYSTGAIIILFVILCQHYRIYELLFYMIIIHISVILINFFASMKNELKRSFKIDRDEHLNGLLEFIDSKEPRYILSIPTKLNFTLSNFINKNHKFYFQFITEKSIDGFKKQQEDEIIYNFVKPDFNHFAEKYGIDTIAVEKKALRKSKKRYGIEYNFSDLELAFENDKFLVYRN